MTNDPLDEFLVNLAAADPRAAEGLGIPPAPDYSLLGEPHAPKILAPRRAASVEEWQSTAPPLPVDWKPSPEGLAPFLSTTGERLAWAPAGPAAIRFLRIPCGEILEALAHGPRGSGKSLLLLADFLTHLHFGPDCRGILFRETFDSLSDLIHMSRRLYSVAFPSASYNQTDRLWNFPGGATLKLSYLADPEDSRRVALGKTFSWVGHDELTAQRDLDAYRTTFATLRTTRTGLHHSVRAATNPSGPAHSLVKHRFRPDATDPSTGLGPIIEENGQRRVAIQIPLTENLPLMHADPKYIERIQTSARSPGQGKAWTTGDWTGGDEGFLFADLWDPQVHILPAFPPKKLIGYARFDRTFDWGLSAPFSIGFWAEIESPIQFADRHFIRGDLIRIAEIYGAVPGSPNEGLRLSVVEIAALIKRTIAELRLDGHVRAGDADSMIFGADDTRRSIAQDFVKAGIRWHPTPKGPGSILQGCLLLRERLAAAKSPRERKALFVLPSCTEFIAQIPTLARDPKNPDIYAAGLDHLADEVRYRLLARARTFYQGIG